MEVDAPEDLAIPGQLLGTSAEYVAGPGTFERDGSIYSSLVGRFQVDSSNTNDLPLIRVDGSKPRPTCPRVDGLVTGEVIRINPKYATIRIMVVDGVVTAEDFEGIIRQADVRATDKDRVELYNTFQFGDLVKAKVISLGDAKSYFLSTAEKDLGVVLRAAMATAR